MVRLTERKSEPIKMKMSPLNNNQSPSYYIKKNNTIISHKSQKNSF